MKSPQLSNTGVAYRVKVMALAILTFYRTAVLAFLGTCALFLACASSAWAAPGDLDPTFGGVGKVTTPIFTQASDGATVYAVAVQPNGKIVAAGSAFRARGSCCVFTYTACCCWHSRAAPVFSSGASC